MSFQVKKIISQLFYEQAFSRFALKISPPFEKAFALSEGYPTLLVVVAVLRMACQVSSDGFVLPPLGLPYLSLSLPVRPALLALHALPALLSFPAIPVLSSSLTALCKAVLACIYSC